MATRRSLACRSPVSTSASPVGRFGAAPLFVFVIVFLSTTATASAKRFPAVGVRAIDGDSIAVRMESGEEIDVRLLSIDCAEKGQPTADAAMRFTNAFVKGQRLTLETDIDTFDRYGRLLAHVLSGSRYLNRELVERGLAIVYVIPPNTAHTDILLEAQALAHSHLSGMWNPTLRLIEPRTYRRGKTHWRPLIWERAQVTGNRKSHVAHWPRCRHVDGVSARNLVIFGTTKEAIAAGYRMEKGYD